MKPELNLDAPGYADARAAWRGAPRAAAAAAGPGRNFWIGLLMIVVFAIHLEWLPAFGYGRAAHLVMPAIALGWYPVAAMTRIIRSGMLDVLDSDYIRMGRAVGAPEPVLIWKYAFRNAAIPLVTVLGVYFASALGAAFWASLAAARAASAWPRSASSTARL